MFRVHNLSPGRVQIRSAGRSTPGGGSEIVDSISVQLVRLANTDPPLVRWEEIGADMKAKPADAPPPPPPVAPVVVKPVVQPEPVAPSVEPSPAMAEIEAEVEMIEAAVGTARESEILKIAGAGIKATLPVTEVVEEPEPVKEKKAKAAVSDEPELPAHRPPAGFTRELLDALDRELRVVTTGKVQG